MSRITSDRLAYPEVSSYRYAKQSDGKVLIGAVTARGDIAISRFTNSMVLDTSFGIGGTLVRDFGSSNDKLADVTVLPNGKILVAGSSGSAYFVQRWESNGLLDTGFGQNGTARATFPRVDQTGATIPGIAEAEAQRLAVDPGSGALSVVGWVRRVRDGAALAGIARFTAAGALDTTFGDANGIAFGFNPYAIDRLSVDSAMIDSQHRLVFGELAATGIAYIVRVTPSGEADPSFGNQGIVSMPSIARTVAVGLVPGDKLLALGDKKVYRFTASGTLDTTYGTGGAAAVGGELLLALPDGSAIVTGAGQEGMAALVHLNPSGVRDRDFGWLPWLESQMALVATAEGFDALSYEGRDSYSMSGPGSSARATRQQFTGVLRAADQIVRRPSGGFVALVTTRDGGDVVYASDGSRSGDDTGKRLIGLTAAGLIDTSFGTGGSVVVPAATQMIALDDAGRTLLVEQKPGSTGVLVQRFSPAGVRDAAFGTVGISTAGASSIAYQSGHGLLLAGDSIVRLTDAGVLDSTFAVAGRYVPSNGSISTITVGSGGSIYVADGWNDRVTRLDPSGRIDLSYGVGGIAPAKDLADDGAVAVAPSGRLFFRTYDRTIGALTATGADDPTFFVDSADALDPYATPARSFVVDADDRVIVAFAVDGQFALRRYGVDGSVDPSFGPGGTAVVPLDDGLGSCVGPSDMLLEPSGAIVTAGCSNGDAVVARHLGGGPVPPLGDPILNVPSVQATVGTDTHLRFTIGLSRPASQLVTVHAKTSNHGSAVAGVDYTAVDTTVTIPPGGSSATVDVPIKPHPGAYDSLDVGLELDPVPGTRMRTTSASGTIHQTPAKPGIIDAPELEGPLDPGDRAGCNTGYWSGTLPHQVTIAWLRDGMPISGEVDTALQLRNADAGHALACRVTVTNTLGSTSATTDSVLVGPATDFTPPTITIREPVDGAHYLRGEDVYGRFSCNDAGGSGVERCSGAEIADTSTPGTHSFTVTSMDRAGNATSKTVTYIVDEPTSADTTPPTITITTPTEGQHVPEGAVARTSFACADLGGSGIATCQGPEFLDTHEPGAATFTVTATDRAGNRTTKTVHYVIDPRPSAATPTPTPTPTPTATPTPPASDGPPAKIAAPAVAATSKAKLSALTKGVSTNVTGVRARSDVTVTVRLGKKTLTTIKAKANATGRAKILVRLSKKQRQGLRKGQKLTLRYTLTTTDGKQKTINRTIALS